MNQIFLLILIIMLFYLIFEVVFRLNKTKKGKNRGEILRINQIFSKEIYFLILALDVVEEEVEGDQSQVWKSHASYFPLRAINLVFCCEFSTACALHSLVQYFCAVLLLCSFL